TCASSWPSRRRLPEESAASCAPTTTSVSNANAAAPAWCAASAAAGPVWTWTSPRSAPSVRSAALRVLPRSGPGSRARAGRAASRLLKLVLDWDGTVTVRDSQWMLLEEFGDRKIFEATEGALGTALSYRDVMEQQVATIRAPLAEAVAFLVENVEVRAGFREL